MSSASLAVLVVVTARPSWPHSMAASDTPSAVFSGAGNEVRCCSVVVVVALILRMVMRAEETVLLVRSPKMGGKDLARAQKCKWEGTRRL